MIETTEPRPAGGSIMYCRRCFNDMFKVETEIPPSLAVGEVRANVSAMVIALKCASCGEIYPLDRP